MPPHIYIVLKLCVAFDFRAQENDDEKKKTTENCLCACNRSHSIVSTWFPSFAFFFLAHAKYIICRKRRIYEFCTIGTSIVHCAIAHTFFFFSLHISFAGQYINCILSVVRLYCIVLSAISWHYYISSSSSSSPRANQ